MHRCDRRVVMMAVMVPKVMPMEMHVVMPMVVTMIMAATAVVFDACWSCGRRWGRGWHIDGFGRGGSAHGGVRGQR